MSNSLIDLLRLRVKVIIFDQIIQTLPIITYLLPFQSQMLVVLLPCSLLSTFHDSLTRFLLSCLCLYLCDNLHWCHQLFQLTAVILDWFSIFLALRRWCHMDHGGLVLALQVVLSYLSSTSLVILVVMDKFHFFGCGWPYSCCGFLKKLFTV